MPSLGVVAFSAVGWFFAVLFFIRCRILEDRLRNMKEFKTIYFAMADGGGKTRIVRKERP